MLTKRRLLSWLSAVVCLALAVPALSALPRALVTTVQHVSDGDTVIATSDNGTTLRTRVLGFDARESAPTATACLVGEGGRRRC